MSQQTVYASQSSVIGFPGQRVGENHQADSYINDLGSKPEIIDLTIAAATASEVLTFTINGITVEVTNGDAPTIPSIRDAIIEKIRSMRELEGICTVNPSGEAVRITGALDLDLTVSESEGNLGTSSIQAYVAAQPIPFGRAVVKRTGTGTNDQSCQLPSETGQTFLGIAERIHSDVDSTNAGENVAPSKVVTVGNKGDYLVEVEEAVAIGNNVFFIYDSTNNGKFRTDADTSRADQITTAEWKSSASAGGLAVLRLK